MKGFNYLLTRKYLCTTFFIVVECAHLRGGSSFSLKPNPYVELSVDNQHPNKTEVVKCTYQPKWNEDFIM